MSEVLLASWPKRSWPDSVSWAGLSLTCRREVPLRGRSSLPMIILDTNVVSELMRRYAIERLPDGRRKEGLLSAATDLLAAFGNLVHPFDARAAAWLGPIMVRRASLELPIEGFDAQIAAICRPGARQAGVSQGQHGRTTLRSLGRQEHRFPEGIACTTVTPG